MGKGKSYYHEVNTTVLKVVSNLYENFMCSIYAV